MRYPYSFYLKICSLFLIPFLYVFQIILYLKASWWKLPVEPLSVHFIGMLIFSLILAIFLFQGKKIALRLYVFFSISAEIFVLIFAYQEKNFYLGLSFFFAFALVFSHYQWFKKEYLSSYWSKNQFFVGAAKAIPGLFCSIVGKDIKLRIAQFGLEGVLVIFEQEERGFFSENLKGLKKCELILGFKNFQLSLEGILVKILKKENTIGFRFVQLTFEQRKKLEELYHLLRGEGYVE